MRRVLITTAGLLCLIGATTAVGKPAETKTNKPQQALEQGMQAVALNANNANSHADAQDKVNSQGAEHASQNAILKVCTKDTPAAQRAAICKNFVSPD
jgi:type II secretory pathway component PulM